jgi:hypothetical protein
MKLVYIAGPFRGASAWDIENNIRRAEVVGFGVAQLGAAPVIPHTMYRFWDGTQTAQFWLDATMDLLRRCDAIVMCEGWEASEGSRAERQEALRMGLQVFYHEPGGENAYISTLKGWIAACS